jgi:hypothetical protein
VILTEGDETRRLAMPNQFGYFRFKNVPVGQSVTIAAGSEKFRFSLIAVTVNKNIQDLNLTVQR